MAKKISISFKETKKDQELYNLLMSMEDKSHEIKEILRKELIEFSKEQQQNKSLKNDEENVDIDITDF